MLKIGKIKKYNEQRGFGFIEVEDSQQELFFHIKDFPKGNAPQVGEKLTFNIQQYENKLKAVNITRLDVVKNASNSRKIHHSTSKDLNIFGILINALIVGMVGYFVYEYISNASHRSELASQPVTTETLSIANQQVSHQMTSFKCDGRIHCSQMTSKAEANWFVANCPGTKMDGDNDGDACENDSRW